MERSVLFFDIDGTILSEITKEIPKDAIEALKAAQAEGHLLFIRFLDKGGKSPADRTYVKSTGK